uniref:Uncharacterized protein n=1 Tax=Ascaris lumbricoides TaxID=6252 RepID=A0A0M3HUR9_ASCLU
MRRALLNLQGRARQSKESASQIQEAESNQMRRLAKQCCESGSREERASLRSRGVVSHVLRSGAERLRLMGSP